MHLVEKKVRNRGRRIKAKGGRVDLKMEQQKYLDQSLLFPMLLSLWRSL